MTDKFNYFHIHILLTGLLALFDVSAATIILNDFQVMNLNASQAIEPSGLTLKDGQLYTVCDDTNAIFKINILDHQNAEA